jgi:NADH dehydrogenase
MAELGEDPRSNTISGDGFFGEALLVEGGPENLGYFRRQTLGESGPRAGEERLEIYVNSIVTRIDAEGVDIKGLNGSAALILEEKICETGVWASPLAKMLADATGAQCDRAGRIRVQPDCSATRPPGSFRGRQHDELQ